jgi:hypothetical protein
MYGEKMLKHFLVLYGLLLTLLCISTSFFLLLIAHNALYNGTELSFDIMRDAQLGRSENSQEANTLESFKIQVGGSFRIKKIATIIGSVGLCLLCIVILIYLVVE